MIGTALSSLIGGMAAGHAQIDQQMELVGLLGTSVQLKYHQQWALANLQNYPYLPYNHQPGVPPPTALMAPVRCAYCRMSDFAHHQCQRCGAPQR